jgi:hypothetical protein
MLHAAAVAPDINLWRAITIYRPNKSAPREARFCFSRSLRQYTTTNAAIQPAGAALSTAENVPPELNTSPQYATVELELPATDSHTADVDDPM